MIMSIAAFFSRLNIMDELFPERASTTCLLWRRMAMKIPMWFTTGTMSKITPRTTSRTKDCRLGKIKTVKPVHIWQVVPDKITDIRASVDKKYIWVIGQARGQDNWMILAKFLFACLWTETDVEVHKLAKTKNEVNIQPSWPKKLGQ